MIEVTSIPRIGHREAMDIASEENRRLLAVAETITDDEWSMPTDCSGWDVRAITLHLIGSADSQASIRELVHQFLAGRKALKEIDGVHWIDGLNEVQNRDRASISNVEIPMAWRRSSERALRARRRMPAAVRALPVLPLGPPLGRKSLGYLFDMGFTRDVFAHRIDITRAVGRPMELTAAHDGRLLADIVAEWAKLHGEPFTLVLTGEAGATFTSGTQGQRHELDAIEFVRILSGRATGAGVLRHALPL